MRTFADVAAYDKDGQLALVVEAKSRLHTTAAWAAQMRRNLFAHGIMPKSNYFMLAMPDNLYLWRSKEIEAEPAKPDYVISPEPLFRRYLEDINENSLKLGEQSLGILINSWISDLIQSGLPDDLPEPQRAMLSESGLVDAIRGGRVTLEELI
jgi:hypothetical protein